MLVASSGLSTTAPLTVAPKPRNVYAPSFRNCNWFTPQSMPVGSTRWRSTSRSCKVLTPNDFKDLDDVAERLLDFQYYWEATAQPFQWKFTRDDLTTLLEKLKQNDTALGAALQPHNT